MPGKDNAGSFICCRKLGTTEPFSLHTVEALAGFHVVQSSASLLSADGDPVVFQMQHTHICVQQMIQSHLSSEVKMSLQFLQDLVLLKASS